MHLAGETTPPNPSIVDAAGGKHKNWRKRWFILTDNCLYYFQYPSDKEPRGIIPLVNLEVNDYTDPKKQVRCSIVLQACGMHACRGRFG